MIGQFESSPGRLVWSVAALLRAVADSVAARFGSCTLRGEISGFTRAPSGHCYFAVRDAGGGNETLKCAMFRRAAGLLDFAPADGMRVELRGRLDVYTARGELQLVVEAMQRDGIGALYEQFLRLRARLEAQGLFDPARRRAVPAYPQAVGVVTSLAAAALHDVLTTLARRAPHVRVIVYPCSVQGAGAPAEIVSAIESAGQRREVETLIVCRGGGSIEDLWAFNDEAVVRAIVASPIPVVCGVGHESDVSLSDLAADLRAATPTAAAELSVAAREDCVAALGGLARRMMRGMNQRLAAAEQHVDRLAALLRTPVELVEREAQRLRWLARRLPSGAALAVHKAGDALRTLASRSRHAAQAQRVQQRHRLERLATRLASCNPEFVLARGYALVQTSDGRLVIEPAQLHAGAQLDLTLARGKAQVQLANVVAK